MLADLPKSKTETKTLVDRALRLENKLFALYQAGRDYNRKSRALLFNLSDTKNPEPLLALIREIITPEDLCTMDPRLLASSKMKREREKASSYGLWNKRTDWDQEVVKQNADFKGMFKCESCFSDRTGFI
jgi:hypothetical protein